MNGEPAETETETETEAVAVSSGLSLFASAVACVVILTSLVVYGWAWSRGRSPAHHPWAGLGQLFLALGLLATRGNAVVRRGGPLAVTLVVTYALLALLSAGLWSWSTFTAE